MTWLAIALVFACLAASTWMDVESYRALKKALEIKEDAVRKYQEACRLHDMTVAMRRAMTAGDLAEYQRLLMEAAKVALRP